MKTHWMIPIAALGGGFASFILRTIQNRTGFDGRLPIPGSPAAAALLILLLLLCVLLFILTRSLSGPGVLPPPADSPVFLVLPGLGCTLLFAAGAVDIYEGLTGENLMDAVRAALSPGLRPYLPTLILQSAQDARIAAVLQVLCGLLLLGGTAALLCLLSLFRPGHPRKEQPFRNEFLLLAPLSLTARLVVFYRRECVNPVMEDYIVGLMALAFLTAAVFALISFQFRQGSLRNLAFYSGCSIVFCLCSLADSPDWLSTVLLNGGASLLLLGFLSLFLWRGEAFAAHGEKCGGFADTDSAE